MVWYVLRRGMFSTLKKQWDEGVYHHLWRPMKMVDLTKEARIDGLSVREFDCDFNYHFTVSKIVPASEQGYYQLLRVTGLAHMEYYFGRIFFCCNLTCNFYKEIPLGHSYYLRAKVINVNGPIIVCSVSFYDAADDLCFTVDWSLLMPVGGVEERKVYDFEVGLSGVDGSKESTQVPPALLESRTTTFNDLQTASSKKDD